MRLRQAVSSLICLLMFGAVVILMAEPGEAAPSLYRDAVMADSPVIYWRLGEATASPGPLDQVSNSVKGSYGTGTTFGISPGALFNEPAETAIGYTGAATTFGTNSTALGQSLFGGKSALTVEFWLRPNVNQSGIHFLEYGSSDFSLESGSLNPSWWLNNSANMSVPLTQSAFQQVDLVFDGTGGTMRAYVNGVLVNSKLSGVPATIANLSSNFFLGSRNGNSRIPNADFQELAIFNSALSASQIQAHYAAAFAFEIPLAPEPASWALLLVAGIGGAMWYRFFRRRGCVPA